MKRNVTLNEVAAAAGVSKTAASKALFGGAATIKVSQKTIAKVRQAAEELNYHPNQTARALNSGKTNLIGLMFGGAYDVCRMELVMHIQRLLMPLGYIGAYVSWNTNDEFETSMRAVLKQKMDGIITAHPIDALPSDIPVVVYAGEHERYDYVKLNKADRIQRSVAYLASLGHREIGLVSVTRQGFEEGMKALSYPVDTDWIVPSDGYFESGEEAARHYLQLPRRPTAIVARNDMVAMALMAEFQKHGVMVPRDVSVIGYNNIMAGGHVTPRLTTFDMQTRASAELLVDTLMARLRNPDAPRKRHEVSLKLVVRDSCAPLARS